MNENINSIKKASKQVVEQMKSCTFIDVFYCFISFLDLRCGILQWIQQTDRFQMRNVKHPSYIERRKI